jgi:hypothetical protein
MFVVAADSQRLVAFSINKQSTNVAGSNQKSCISTTFRSRQTDALLPRSPRCWTRKQTPLTVKAVAVPQGKGRSGSSNGGAAAAPSKLTQLLTPFSDPAANSKLLSLCTAQMLCSVATLIHDTYLPVYLSDVLHLSNSKVCPRHLFIIPILHYYIIGQSFPFHTMMYSFCCQI